MKAKSKMEDILKSAFNCPHKGEYCEWLEKIYEQGKKEGEGIGYGIGLKHGRKQTLEEVQKAFYKLYFMEFEDWLDKELSK